jgi:Regulator of chromosome condensation (RCC1) repeat
VAIDAGFQHTLALRSDGTLAVWGANYAGAINMPSGINQVIAISAGGHHNIVLRADRTLVSWGDATIGQAPLPLYATNLVSISAGAAHNVAIMDSMWPLVVSLDSPALKPQSVQVSQTLRVFNRSPFTYPSVRVHISNLPPLTLVRNAAGLDEQGNPYLQSGRMLPPGGSIDLPVLYVTPDGSLPKVEIAGEVAVLPTGTPQPISRFVRQANGNYLLQFPSAADRSYYVQYSSDLSNWTVVYPSIPGTGADVQWLDTGPPYTDATPVSRPNRFYRLVAP